MFKRYLLHLCGLAVLDLGITGAYLAVTQNVAVISQALLLNVGTLVALNAVGGWLLFAPIRRLEKTQAPAPELVATVHRRIVRLPIYSAIWAAALGVIYSGAIAYSGLFLVPEQLPAAAMDDAGIVLAVFAAAYAVYFSFYAFFAVSNFGIDLRRHMATAHNVRVAATGPKMGVILGVAFIGLTIPPAMLIVADLTVLSAFRAAQGITLSEAILLDLGGTILAASLSFYFLARLLTLPTASLIEAVGRIQDDDFDIETPVIVDHEIGELSQNFSAMAAGLSEKERIKRTFEMYVSEPIVRSILSSKDGGDGRLPGELRLATVMFTDIEGFTTLSERITPVQLVDILNDYFERISTPVHDQGGLVVNYIGDAMMAVFNVPVETEDHASRAIAAAMEIQRLTEDTLFDGQYTLRTRIGIHTGPVVAGSVGGHDRLAYTVYGDTVNAAARLEEENKTYRTRILASEATVGLARRGASAGEGVQFDALGSCGVRGRSAPLQVFSVAAAAPAAAVSTIGTAPGTLSVARPRPAAVRGA